MHVCVRMCVCVCVCVFILATSSAALQETQKALYQPCSRVLLQLAGLGLLCRSLHSHTVDQDIPGGLPPYGHQNSLHHGDPHTGSWGPKKVSRVIRKPLGGLPALLQEEPLCFHHVTWVSLDTLKAVWKPQLL